MKQSNILGILKTVQYFFHQKVKPLWKSLLIIFRKIVAEELVLFQKKLPSPNQLYLQK